MVSESTKTRTSQKTLLVVLYNVSKYSMIFHQYPHKILDASPSSPCCTSGAKISELGPESEPGGTIAIFIQTGSVHLQVAKATDIAGDKERHQRKVATCGNHHFSFWVSPRSKWWNSNQINPEKSVTRQSRSGDPSATACCANTGVDMCFLSAGSSPLNIRAGTCHCLLKTSPRMEWVNEMIKWLSIWKMDWT